MLSYSLPFMVKQVERDQLCYCCGTRNERGLQLEFLYPDATTAVTELDIPEYYTGWRNIVHGGLLAMLLDEAMAHACLSSNIFGVTAEMTVRYIKPVSVGEHIKVVGKVKVKRGKVINTQGWIYSSQGSEVAQGRARYLELSPRTERSCQR